MASEAPCPEVGEGACAASPMMIIRSVCQFGRGGMVWTGLAARWWPVASISALLALALIVFDVLRPAKRGEGGA